jgi:flagellar FliJ protein
LAKASLLAEARSAADRARQSEAAIRELRETSDAQRFAALTTATTVGLLRNASYMTEQLDQQLEMARTVVRAADGKVDICLSDFMLALQERRALDRLKEKRMEAAIVEEGKAEQSATDEIALTRFVRSEGGDEAS